MAILEVPSCCQSKAVLAVTCPRHTKHFKFMAERFSSYNSETKIQIWGCHWGYPTFNPLNPSGRFSGHNVSRHIPQRPVYRPQRVNIYKADSARTYWPISASVMTGLWLAALFFICKWIDHILARFCPKIGNKRLSISDVLYLVLGSDKKDLDKVTTVMILTSKVKLMSLMSVILTILVQILVISLPMQAQALVQLGMARGQ